MKPVGIVRLACKTMDKIIKNVATRFKTSEFLLEAMSNLRPKTTGVEGLSFAFQRVSSMEWMLSMARESRSCLEIRSQTKV